MSKKKLSPEEVSYEIAKQQVALANKTDRTASAYVLNGATITLRGLLEHQLLPDAEQRIYLQFVLESLERVLNAKSPELPNKAFKWSSPNRPQRRTDTESLALFLKVGVAYDQNKKEGRSDPVKIALQSVARKEKLKWETVKRDFWSAYGGLKGWKRVKSAR
jgi:hypothetical protein